MITSNKVAIYNVLKGLLVAGGPIAILLTSALHLDSNMANVALQLVSAGLSIVGLAWLGISGTDANVVQHAGDVPGVQVHVDTTVAPAPVVDVAKDKSANPDVVPMIGAPRSK